MQKIDFFNNMYNNYTRASSRPDIRQQDWTTMKEISNELLGPLARCARIMAGGGKPWRKLGPIDLLQRGGDYEDAVSFLTHEVRRRTRGRLTVRMVDHNDFPYPVKGVALYLAVCDGDTPPGKLTDPDKACWYYLIGPYDFGLRYC
jgi:hypothetical protein